MKITHELYDDDEEVENLCAVILKKMGIVDNLKDAADHPMAAKLFDQMYQNELTLEFDVDKLCNVKLKSINSAAGTWKIKE